jgi:2-methylcitrate dehydratase PrpD
VGATETRLATFATGYPTAAIPPEIIHLGKRCAMNYAAVALFASVDPSLDILLDLFETEGSRPIATVLGRGVKTSAQNAALANGYLGHFEDYDDTHVQTVIHPSAPILPAALAVSELRSVSGRDLLAAFAIGVDVACRIGDVVAPHFRAGAEHWHITNTCGVLGAAAAAGRLLGLTADQMVYAFAIAGTQASGVREVFGSMCKPFHAGRAAQSGLLAALLAQRGFTGTDGIFEGPRGLVGALATGHDIAQATEGLGERWELPNNGLKPYACGLANHGFIDAVLALRKRDGVQPDTVQHIQGSVARFAPALVRRRHPSTGLEGKFCYYHAMAVALTDGSAYPAQFTDERAVDPVVHSLRDRIDVNEDPSLPRRTAVVTLTTTDGRTYTERVDHSTGTPENPMSDAQVEEKLRALTGAVLNQVGIDRAVQTLWELDKLPSAADLPPLLCETAQP